jgi:hypothetical protein
MIRTKVTQNPKSLRGFWFSCIAIGVGRTIEEADGIGFQFDDELLDRMFGGVLAGADFDLAIIIVRADFALDEDKCAFDEAFGHLTIVCSKTKCYVESNRPFKQRNTLGMLPFLLKPVDLFGGHRCI